MFDRGALATIRLVVDQYHGFTVTLVNRTRPVHVDGEVEAVESCVVIDSFIDMPRPAALAFPGSGPRVEVAWATPIAVACNENLSVEMPSIAHGGSIRMR